MFAKVYKLFFFLIYNTHQDKNFTSFDSFL